MKIPHAKRPRRKDVRNALDLARWRKDDTGALIAPNGALWTETNDHLDSRIDAPDQAWSVPFGADVPAVAIVSTCLIAARQTRGETST